MDKTLIEFLQNKCVSPEVAAQKKISRLHDGSIAIPIFDIDGNFRFNKYRRDPEAPADSSAPKYTYDKGATAMLYNAQMIKCFAADCPVFICEGEFKALCLESFGMLAVSSTGGAGTFRKEWADMLAGRDIYIVLDNDFAGIKGAFSLQQKISYARIIFLPAMANGKDITDLASIDGTNFPVHFNNLIEISENWHFDDNDVFDNKTAINDRLKELDQRVKDIMWKIQDAKSNDMTGDNPYPWLDIYKSIVLVHIDKLKKIKKFFVRHKLENKYGDAFQNAKAVPISNFIRFSPSGYARSVWNKNDKNPSMKLYPETNRVYDYSTGQGGDAIDAYMAFKGIKFKEAVDALSSGKY